VKLRSIPSNRERLEDREMAWRHQGFPIGPPVSFIGLGMVGIDVTVAAVARIHRQCHN
jgi:hypothetical protein